MRLLSKGVAVRKAANVQQSCLLGVARCVWTGPRSFICTRLLAVLPFFFWEHLLFRGIPEIESTWAT